MNTQLDPGEGYRWLQPEEPIWLGDIMLHDWGDLVIEYSQDPNGGTAIFAGCPAGKCGFQVKRKADKTEGFTDIVQYLKSKQQSTAGVQPYPGHFCNERELQSNKGNDIPYGEHWTTDVIIWYCPECGRIIRLEAE